MKLKSIDGNVFPEMVPKLRKKWFMIRESNNMAPHVGITFIGLNKSTLYSHVQGPPIFIIFLCNYTISY